MQNTTTTPSWKLHRQEYQNQCKIQPQHRRGNYTDKKFLSSLGNFPSRIDKSTLKISRMSQRLTFGNRWHDY